MKSRGELPRSPENTRIEKLKKISAILFFLLMIVLVLSGCKGFIVEKTNINPCEPCDQIINELEQELVDSREEIETLQLRIQKLQTDLLRSVGDDGQPWENLPDAEQRAILEKLALEIIGLVENQNFEALSTYAHPEKEVRFSMYLYVDEFRHPVFSREQVASFGKDETVYYWNSGKYFGDGCYEDTVANHWTRYISPKNPEPAWRMLLEGEKHNSDSIDNFWLIYPEGYHIDFCREGETVLAWKLLRFGFEIAEDGNYYLIVIIHDEWTP